MTGAGFTFAGVCALFGLLVGSFLNVVVHRVPARLSVVSPPSACPGCGSQIRARDNVPVLSWLLLRGRCRDCGTRISARYPLTELLTAIVYAALGLAVGPHWDLPAMLYLGALSVALSLIDVDVHRLPNAIVLPAYPVSLALLAPAAALDSRWSDLLRGLAGGTILFVIFLLLALVKPGAMGFGDVKLVGVLGLYLGWEGWGTLLVGAFLPFLVGGAVGVAMMVGSGAGRNSPIPFGPFLLLGALVAVVWGASLAHAYVDLLIL